MYDSRSPAAGDRRARRAEGPGGSEFQSDHPAVDGFVNKFETNMRGFFQNALDRSATYVPMMLPILEQEGVPAELAYLPLIESGYRTHAVSSAGASGPWQFIPATGRRYGLRVDGYVDERRDPVKSTRAAARYLKDLYGMFGQWHLSLAAYNTGEMRISRIINRGDATNFWDMADGGYLHPETKNYVPQFLAAVQIARSPQEYGFWKPPRQPLRYDLVRVEHSIPLRTIASATGTSVEDLEELNPALVRKVTPPDPSGYVLRVPEGTKPRFVAAYDAMRAAAEAERQQRSVARSQVRKKSRVASRSKSSSRVARSARPGAPRTASVQASKGTRRSAVVKAAKASAGRKPVVASARTKAPTKAQASAVRKPTTKTAAKAPTSAVRKPATKTAAKAPTSAVRKPATKTAAKAQTGSVRKPATKAAAKGQTSSVAKPAAKAGKPVRVAKRR